MKLYKIIYGKCPYFARTLSYEHTERQQRQVLIDLYVTLPMTLQNRPQSHFQASPYT